MDDKHQYDFILSYLELVSSLTNSCPHIDICSIRQSSTHSFLRATLNKPGHIANYNIFSIVFLKLNCVVITW